MPKKLVHKRIRDDATPACGDVNSKDEYWCTCVYYCGSGDWISKASYFRHAKHRKATASGNTHSPPAGSNEPPHKRSRNSDAIPAQDESAHEAQEFHEQLTSPRHFRTPSPLHRQDEYPRSPTPRPRVRAASPDDEEEEVDDPPLPPRPDRGSLAWERLQNVQPDPLLQEEEEPRLPEDDELPDPERDEFAAGIEELKITQSFRRMLRDASHANGALNEAQLSDLLNPSHEPIDIDSHQNRVLKHCIRNFISHRNGSDSSYSEFVASSIETYPDDAESYLSLDQIKRRIAQLSGVYAITTDQCINSCVAYAGPFADLDSCPYCDKPRRDEKGKPFQTFDTMPVGPQLQALRRHPEAAVEMKYLWQKILDVQRLTAENNGKLPEFDDIACGSAILEAVDAKKIGEHDFVLMKSIDGAQLYRMKVSDCWMYIWIVVNLSPCRRYKQRYLLPGGFISGPNKPKHLDSYMYVGLHHISAINNSGGLRVYDASINAEYLCRIFLLFALADGPGSIYLSGLVTHSGKFGCRVFCEMPGRRKHGDSHYWPACLKPLNYDEPGCNHDDINPAQFRPTNEKSYKAKLDTVCSAPNQAQYEKRRLETGISKPTIFDGLHPDTVLGAPFMVTEELMHETMNIASALVDLFRGTFQCATTDSVNSWPWAIFRDPDIWQAHGRFVAFCTQFLPGSFGRACRNPAEKINSGYKAWEYLLYIFSLGPGLFVGFLPPDLYLAYCKLVKAFRLLYQKSIKYDDIILVHTLLTSFVDDFERKFYQRRADRLHFVRPSIHNLAHLASEVFRVGPLPGVAQWTLERFIGLITDEMKQHKHPYAHLSRRGLERAQLNALKIAIPSLDLTAAKEGKLPRGHYAVPDGSGYVLLRARDTCLRSVTAAEAAVLRAYIESCGIRLGDGWTAKVVRWSRMLLPNSQVARSAWKECLKRPDELRRARDVKLSIDGKTEFGEVRYYFRLRLRKGDPAGDVKTLAMVSLCSRPNEELLRLSEGMLWSVRHQADAGLRIVEHNCIQAVVAIIPYSPMLGPRFEGQYFVAELPGLDAAREAGDLEEVTDE